MLAVLRADDRDHLSEVRRVLEPVLRRPQPPVLDLALVHRADTAVPHGVAGVVAAFPGARLHNLRWGEQGDVERLARSLIGAGVALVLSGGGARGIAHVGVLKAFEEAGIPIEAIGGTSMGAIAAATFARGWSAETTMDKLRELFRRRTALYDPTLPFEALLAGRKLERVLRHYFGALDIEDLWLPFFCVSTDITRAESHVHERGALWRAVVASCSIPGVFPPRHEDGCQLVDGGVADNLPIDVMADRFEGAIVASDVDLYGGESADGRARTTAGRLVELARWVNPVHREPEMIPAIFEILLRATLVGSQSATLRSLSQGRASLYLRLPVSRFGLVDWRAYEELFAAGYAHACEKLASWPHRVPR